MNALVKPDLNKFDDVYDFLMSNLPPADADNVIRFIRGQEASNLELRAKLRQVQDAGLATNELDMGNYVEVPADQWKRLCDAMFLNLPGNAANNNGWISVDERLPENFSVNLVYSPSSHGRSITTKEFINGKWSGVLGVTHWQPLPAAPKVEMAK